MITPDLPISKSSDDIFNRSSFAASLAKSIVYYSESSTFAIGLYGPWGSGKTSLLNMIVESVETMDSNIIILRFNPWLCSDPKQLVTQFFKQLSTAIKLKKLPAEQVGKLIDQYGDLLDAANSIPTVGAVLAAGGKFLSKKLKTYIDNRSGDLQNKKNQIINKIEAEQIRILVLIDDIDRLSEDEIVAVFQLVKSLADFPNMIYVLAFDYSVVVSALNNVQSGNGKAYLEKIVQVPFEIPAPNMESIYDLLISKLNSILEGITDEQFDQNMWAELFRTGLKKYIKSIRDVIRYTNVLTLKYQLLQNEVNPLDLLGVTCLQVFEPFVYSRLPGFKDIICGSPINYAQDYQKAKEQKIKNALSMLTKPAESITDIDGTINILGLLFPKIRSVAESSTIFGQTYNRQNPLIAHKISASECFDRYFALSLEQDAISNEAIQNFIFNLDEAELDAELIQYYRQGKLFRLLDEISAYATNKNSISEDRAVVITKVLLEKWNEFDCPDRGFFDIPFNWRLLFCTDPLLKAIEPSSRFSYVQSLFENKKIHPSTLSLLMQDFENQLGRFKGDDSDDSSNENPLLPLDDVLELEQVFKRRAVEQLDSSNTIHQKNGLNFLWMLGQLDADLAAEKKKQLVSDDSSLIEIIGYCTIQGRALSSVVSKTRRTNLESLKEFIAVEKAYQRVKAIIENGKFVNLTLEDQLNIGAFIMEVERPESERHFEHSLSDDTIHAFLKQEVVSNS